MRDWCKICFTNDILICGRLFRRTILVSLNIDEKTVTETFCLILVGDHIDLWHVRRTLPILWTLLNLDWGSLILLRFFSYAYLILNHWDLLLFCFHRITNFYTGLPEAVRSLSWGFLRCCRITIHCISWCLYHVRVSTELQRCGLDSIWTYIVNNIWNGMVCITYHYGGISVIYKDLVCFLS